MHQELAQVWAHKVLLHRVDQTRRHLLREQG
jgi:hypothetical protein